MGKIIISLHVSLDGFVAGPNGEMDWIIIDQEMFDLVGSFTAGTDKALYGRVTFEMMDGYWPEAGSQPDASKHDLEHSAWYNRVEKIVISKSRAGEKKEKTQFIGDDIPARVKAIKEASDADIMIFGSPSAAHLLMENQLIDEFWLMINPIVLGAGIPAFPKLQQHVLLELKDTRTFSSGIQALHYARKK